MTVGALGLSGPRRPASAAEAKRNPQRQRPRVENTRIHRKAFVAAVPLATAAQIPDPIARAIRKVIKNYILSSSAGFVPSGPTNGFDGSLDAEHA